MEYDLIQEGDNELLKKAVNMKLMDGWELQGGVAFCSTPDRQYTDGRFEPGEFWLLQAIVKTGQVWPR